MKSEVYEDEKGWLHVKSELLQIYVNLVSSWAYQQ